MKLKDILIIGGLLLSSVSAYFLVNETREEGVDVVVRVNGEIVEVFSLLENGEYELNDGTNILCIKDGEAYLIDADCPDQLCVKSGSISKNGEVITCLPNRLTITVVGGETDVELVS